MDPIAFPNRPTDPMYSDFVLENEGYDNSWLQSISSASPLTSNDDYLVSPHDITLGSSSTCMELESLGMWGIEDPALNFNSMFDNDSISGLNHSRTPSLCDYADSLSPTPNPAEPCPSPEVPSKRKRGRPRFTSDDSESSHGESPTSRKSGISKRQPHHQVERKYREGLNAGLERLRMAIPTLPRLDSPDMATLPKPSKATVLASAIDYIHQIEMECDRLQRENEVLKTGNRNAGLRFSLRS